MARELIRLGTAEQASAAPMMNYPLQPPCTPLFTLVPCSHPGISLPLQVLERLESSAAASQGSPNPCIFYEPSGLPEDGRCRRERGRECRRERGGT